MIFFLRSLCRFILIKLYFETLEVEVFPLEIVVVGNEEKSTPNKIVDNKYQSTPKKFAVYNDQLSAKASQKDTESSLMNNISKKSTDTGNYRSSFGTEYSISF